jgi:CBS domain-containing protein
MTIRDILQVKGVNRNDVFAVSPEARLVDAVAQMVQRDAGSLAVLKDGRLVGMVTFREIMVALDRGKGSLGEMTVGEVMVTEPVYGMPDDSVDYVRQVMTENHIRYLPVIDEEQLVGVISFHDVARAVLKKVGRGETLLRRWG